MKKYKAIVTTFFNRYDIEVEAYSMEDAESLIRENGGIWGITHSVIGVMIEEV